MAKILGIEVSDETAAKWKIRGRKVKDFIVPIGLGIMTAQGIFGWFVDINHDRRLKKLARNQDAIVNCVNQHAAAGNHLIERTDELERQNKILMEKAIRETEGKAS